MTNRAILLAGIQVMLGGVLPAQVTPDLETPAAAEGFGPNEQVLHVGAAKFQSVESSTEYYLSSSDGYLYGNGGAQEFVAPLSLPAGAEVSMLCLYANDANPTGSVWVFLEAVKLPPGGQSPGVEYINSVATTFDIGYGVTCNTPFSYEYHDTGDVDHDGSAEHVAHRLRMAIVSSDPGVGFGGVRVFWRRQVSPAPAAATFADVPTTDGFFPFVEALAASEITAGCGGGNFCPDSPLTRGQMAVFLAKALGLHWPY